jgi:predicted RNA-binding Zn-ribbon protein involved in translation (DUF1610 family)
MRSSESSIFGWLARLILRDQTPYCTSCGRKMKSTQIEPLLTTRVDVVTFTCKDCASEEKRARRRPGKSGAKR